MKTVAIVQARMGSTRFPGKTLEDLCGKTVLERVVSRITLAASIDECVVATTTRSPDDAVAAVAQRAGCGVFRGSEEDVLDRYYRAAAEHGADVIVRNTADEPFLDPALIDETRIALGDADYAANNVKVIYPEGLDTEAFTFGALSTAWRESSMRPDREHVTPFIWRQPERFRIVAAGDASVRPDLRLTIDYPADLDFARALYDTLGETFSLADVVAALGANPTLAAMSPAVPRREGYLRSLREDQR